MLKSTFIELHNQLEAKKLEIAEAKAKGEIKTLRPSQQKAFNVAVRKEIERLQDEGEMGREKVESRHLKVMWDIQCGFNQDEGTFNPVLRAIGILYARIRLGIRPFYFDEKFAAIRAVQEYYLNTIPDAKVPGHGQWAILGAFMLHWHLVGRGITAPTMHERGGKDQRWQRHRDRQSKTIWVKHYIKNPDADNDDETVDPAAGPMPPPKMIEGKPIKCMVESRPEVRKELLQMLNMTANSPELPIEVPAPEDDDDEQNEPVRKKPRRSFSLNYKCPADLEL